MTLLQQRKEILVNFYNTFKKKYPFYIGPNKKELPKPIYPVNIQRLTRPTDEMHQLTIAEPQKSILCGTILSDTTIGVQRGYANARMQNRHSTRQYEWFFWKWLIALENFSNGLSSMTFQEPDGYQINSLLNEGETLGKLHINSKAMPDLTKLSRIVKKDNQKFIDRSWLNHMSSYFLMCIWIDDGSLYHTYQGCICFDYSTKDEQQTFCDYLKEAWDIEAYVGDTDYPLMADGRERFRIFFSDQTNLLKYLRIVAPLVPVKEMIYKLLFVPVNNPVLLQRWASELKDLVQPEFREYVEDFYEDKGIGR